MHKCLLFNVSTTQIGRNLGVYRIAHYLREHDWDSEVIDYTLYWTLDELKELSRSRIDKNTKFIGFGHMFSVWSVELENFTEWLKIEYPGVVLISGSGVAPQFKSKCIDYYIQGFGENALLVLLKWLFNNGELPKFSIFNKKLINGNEMYPSFPMKSLMVKYQDRDYISPDEWLGIEFSRGCKFSCAFCNFPVLGVKGDYSRDALDYYTQVMDAYDRFGVTNYFVSDETFNDRTEKITKFADATQLLPFRPWFSGFIRADLMISRKEEKEELARLGFLGHHYGIESFNKESVKVIGKGMDPERIKAGLIDTKNYFMNRGLYRGSISLIIGLPGDTAEQTESTIDWLKENWQGQSFIPFALEIPVGEFDTPSKISIDYKKYGYTVMDDAIIRSNEDHDMIDMKVASTALNWQNKFMNINQAMDLQEKMYYELFKEENGFTLNCWGLGSLGIDGGLTNRLNQIAKVSQGDFAVAQPKIQSYKDKKLSTQKY
jgi:radical SAM superfamily enzyme YgiQ (UPF0313 family)